MTLEKFDLPLGELEAQMFVWVKEALALRFGDVRELPGPDAGQRAVLSGLVEARSRQDRAEELLTRILIARGRLRRLQAVAASVFEEAWSRQSQVERQNTKRSGDFISPTERSSDANLATLTQKRDLLAAERLVSSADEAYEVIRTVHRGLDSFRSDHLAIIRAMSWEDSFSRTSEKVDN